MFLGCYPFYDRDPFIIKDLPDIYFLGDQEKADSKILKTPSGSVCNLLSLSQFSKSAEIILVNVKTYKIESIIID